MIFNDTYIVCNSELIPKFKTIKQFTLDLGKSLINSAFQFNPADVKIQKHYMAYSEIINLGGYIGSLCIYTNRSLNINTFNIYNEDKMFEYVIDTNISLYDNINLAIDTFFKKYEIKKDVVTTNTEISNAEKEYIKPDKKLTDMTEAERIQYARNRFN